MLWLQDCVYGYASLLYMLTMLHNNNLCIVSALSAFTQVL